MFLGLDIRLTKMELFYHLFFFFNNLSNQYYHHHNYRVVFVYLIIYLFSAIFISLNE
jgi:hypothetical protein